MKKEVLSINGDKIKEIEIEDKILDCEVSDGAIYHAIRNNLANKRVGTASTKTRSEVAGSHKKPWSQKKLGRARSGRRQSPVWVGGGITFGPKPRDYNYKIPKKMKRKALFSVLTIKNRNGSLKVVENFDVESGKTKDFVSKIKDMVNPLKKTIFVLSEKFYSNFKDYSEKNELKKINKMEEQKIRRRLSDGFRRAAANIPYVKTLSYSNLDIHDLFYCDNIIFLEESALKLNEFYKDKV